MFTRRRKHKKEGRDPIEVQPGVRFLGRLNRALDLNSEQQDVATAGTWSQLRTLNRLMQQETFDEASRTHVDIKIMELVQTNPELARCKFKIDDFDEYLLHQIICKRPSVELVVYVYQQNPGAAKIPGFGGYSLLHHACWCHASLDVIQFLVAIDEQAIRSGPFPPLFCAVDKETSFDVMEFLVRSYPEALCTSDISSVTPLDIALMDELPLHVIALFVQHYPNSELKVTEKGGSTKLQQEVACILGHDHDIIRTVDASFVKFTTPAQAAFFEVLASNTTLTEIVLNLTDIEVDEMICESFYLFLTKNACIKKFSVCGGVLNEALADSMVRGIHVNGTIDDLVIEGGLSKGGVESLLAGSSEIKNLEKLSLKYTVVDGADWSGLSSFLSLQSLDLSNCQVGTSLAGPLAALLENTWRLEELFVGRNYIGDTGTIAIAKALQKNRSLRKLEYEKNEIGEQGWEAFINSLREFNVTLRFVRFAAEDPFYDKYSPQLLYFCDENGFGRQIVEKKSVVPTAVVDAEDGPVSAPAGEPTAQSVGSSHLILSHVEADFTAEFIEANSNFPTATRNFEDADEGLEEETIEWG